MTVLITGASAGFGEAMCRAFVGAGYRVIGAARRTDRLQVLADELGGLFHPLEMDVSSRESVENALNVIPEAFADIDCLINNAGLALGLDTADTADFGDWETMIQTNVLGLTFLTRKILPNMVARGGGYVMNLGSVAGSYAYPGSNVYGATKAFVRQLPISSRVCAAIRSFPTCGLKVMMRVRQVSMKVWHSYAPKILRIRHCGCTGVLPT